MNGQALESALCLAGLRLEALVHATGSHQIRAYAHQGIVERVLQHADREITGVNQIAAALPRVQARIRAHVAQHGEVSLAMGPMR